MGRNEKLALLKSLVPQLLDTLDLNLMQSTQFLRKVSQICVTCIEYDMMFWCQIGVCW